MPRRLNVPDLGASGVDEIIRPTTGRPQRPLPAPSPRPTASRPAKAAAEALPAASGRVRHEEKMTVYVSSEELIALEQARLTLRAGGVAVDRGRFVRAAIASALDDMAARGLKADVVQRLGD